jgi:hypothetical protein
MFVAMLRVLFGFVLACLAAGLTKVLFSVGPQPVLGGNPDAITDVLLRTAQFATVIAVFSSMFALLAAVISEWQGLRGFFFHTFVGLAIAGAGFGLQYFGEALGAPTIFNNYAMGAYAATGLVGGIVYWLFAGRFAGRADDIYDPVPTTGPTANRQTPRPAPPPPVRPKAAAVPANNLPGAAKPAAAGTPVKPQAAQPTGRDDPKTS